jgi:alpha-D-ribose 1-methylphosphonate 5-triphosphate synthase subunit PhnG
MTPPPSHIAERQRWLAILARSPAEALKQHAIRWWPQVTSTLRAPETGLVMLRGRIGGSGNRFNVGEATVTRCVLRCAGDPHATVGVGYVLGRDAEQARAVALFDALLQQAAHQSRLQRDVLAPLATALADAQARAAARTAASRVRFATLNPEVLR